MGQGLERFYDKRTFPRPPECGTDFLRLLEPSHSKTFLDAVSEGCCSSSKCYVDLPAACLQELMAEVMKISSGTEQQARLGQGLVADRCTSEITTLHMLVEQGLGGLHQAGCPCTKLFP